MHHFCNTYKLLLIIGLTLLICILDTDSFINSERKKNDKFGVDEW